MTNLTEDQKAEIKALDNGYEDFFNAKEIDEDTPLVYLTGIISNQLNEEGSEGIFVGYAVNLVNLEPKKATLILERAGFNVKGLPTLF